MSKKTISYVEMGGADVFPESGVLVELVGLLPDAPG